MLGKKPKGLPSCVASEDCKRVYEKYLPTTMLEGLPTAALPREQTLQQGRVLTAAKQRLRRMSSDPGTDDFSSLSLGFLKCKCRLLQHLSQRLIVRIKNKTTYVVSIQCLAQRKARYSYNPAAMAENPPGFWGEDTQVKVKPQAQTPTAQTRHPESPGDLQGLTLP